MSLPAVALIGTGKMGGAILEGILQPGVDVSSLRATTATEATAATLRDSGVQARSLESDPSANGWGVEGADVVILAVKPHYILDVASSLAPHLQPDTVLVSVAAGITTAQIEDVVGCGVVRAMPNTPSQIRQGVTGIAAGATVSPSQLHVVVELFELVGDVVVVDEPQINPLSAVSGSGPAYLFYIAEKLIEAATRRGFTLEQATTMVNGTLVGSAALLEQSGQTPQELRRAVTSPGGTTEQAIGVFDRHDLGAILSEAIDSAVARAEEMARGN